MPLVAWLVVGALCEDVPFTTFRRFLEVLRVAEHNAALCLDIKAKKISNISFPRGGIKPTTCCVTVTSPTYDWQQCSSQEIFIAHKIKLCLLINIFSIKTSTTNNSTPRRSGTASGCNLINVRPPLRKMN